MTINPIVYLNNLTNIIVNRLGKNRVICIINYGSVLSNSSIEPKDYDLIVLIKDFNPFDYSILREIKINYRKAEIFLDYLNVIKKRGILNYQRGRHGSYFFKVLAYGKCLYGKNYYLKNIKEISLKQIRKDLLYRIEEYFYRIQKDYINNFDLNKEDLQIKKYISRICLDLLLFSGELDFKDMHQFHYKEIFDSHVNNSKLFSLELKYLIKDYMSGTRFENISPLISSLYFVYIKCFENNL